MPLLSSWNIHKGVQAGLYISFGITFTRNYSDFLVWMFSKFWLTLFGCDLSSLLFSPVSFIEVKRAIPVSFWQQLKRFISPDEWCSIARALSLSLNVMLVRERVMAPFYTLFSKWSWRWSPWPNSAIVLVVYVFCFKSSKLEFRSNLISGGIVVWGTIYLTRRRVNIKCPFRQYL